MPAGSGICDRWRVEVKWWNWISEAMYGKGYGGSWGGKGGGCARNKTKNGWKKPIRMVEGMVCTNSIGFTEGRNGCFSDDAKKWWWQHSRKCSFLSGPGVSISNTWLDWPCNAGWNGKGFPSYGFYPGYAPWDGGKAKCQSGKSASGPDHLHPGSWTWEPENRGPLEKENHLPNSKPIIFRFCVHLPGVYQNTLAFGRMWLADNQLFLPGYDDVWRNATNVACLDLAFDFWWTQNGLTKRKPSLKAVILLMVQKSQGQPPFGWC